MDLTKERLKKLAGLLKEQQEGVPASDMHSLDLHSAFQTMQDAMEVLEDAMDRVVEARRSPDPDYAEDVRNDPEYQALDSVTTHLSQALSVMEKLLNR